MADRTAQLNCVVLRDPVCVSPDTTIIDAMAALEQHNSKSRKLQQSDKAEQNRASANCVIVLEQNTVIGLFTAVDMVSFTAKQLPIEHLTLREVITRKPITAKESALADSASLLTLFEQHRISHLPILDEQGGLAGLLSYESLLKSINTIAMERTNVPPAGEERWQLAFSGSKDGIWDWDLKSNIKFFSSRWKEIRGFRDEEIGNSPEECLSRIHPEDYDRVLAVLSAHLARETELFECEYRARCKDGSYLWVLDRGQALRDEAGQAIRLIGSSTDITARKSAELALQEKQAQFQHMTENVPGMIFRYVLHPDKTDELTYVSSQIREVFELEPEAALQSANPLWERVHPDDFPWILEARQVSADTLQPMTKAYRLCLPKKGLRWVRHVSHVERLANGDVVWDGIAIDITDRKQQEQERERLLKIVESTSDYIGIASAEGHILWLNQAFKNFRPDLGDSVDRIHLSAANPAWAYEILQKEAFPTAIEQGTWSGESMILDANGNEVPVSQVLIAHKSDEGEVEYFSTIIRDISDRKAIERQLEFTQYGLDHAADCFYCLDEEANIKQVNQATCQHTGYTQEELLSMTLHELTPTCPKETTWGPHWKKLKRLKSYSFESVQRTKMGEIFPVEVVCNYLEFDGKAYDFELIRDITARKAAEAQRNQHLAAIEAAANGIAILKADRYVYLNHAHLTLLGYSSEELLGQSWQCLYSAEVLEYLEKEVFPLLAQELAWQGEVIATRKDGSCFDQSLSLTLLDEDFVICVFSDISDRKQAEEKLQALSERLELALEGAQIGVWQWDYQNERLSWDERMFAIYGAKPEDFRGTQQDWEKYVHPDDLADAQEGIIRGDSRSSKEFRIIRADGTIRYLFSTVFIQKNHKGECERAVGINLDITDRKQAEIALEEEVLRRSAVFNTSHDGIHILDRAGNLMEANTGFSQMLGYSLNELSHLNVADWNAQFSHAEIQHRFQNYPENMHSTVETLHRRKDGTVFPVEITVCSMEWNGEFAFVCISRDISERKKYEMKLQQTNEELARATRLKDEFLANMSHELRTPLNSILGFSEALKEQILGPLDDKQIEAVSTIERSGNHLLRLINDILDVAKIESGKIELSKSLISISEVCNSSIAFIKQQAIKKKIHLTIDIPQNLPELLIDERRILQVLINLLDNAIKFTPAEGEIALTARYHEQQPEQEEMTTAIAEPDKVQDLKIPQNVEIRGKITIAISDTGIGIASEKMSKLFMPFTQIDSALNRQYAGTGLGLTLVKRIVELHGGVVTLKSEVGVGSCFSITLPYERNNQNAALDSISEEIQSQPVSTPAQSEQSPLILLAEDNESNVQMIVNYLEFHGYRLIIAKNGIEAVNLAKSRAPNLILMDIQMPQMNGMEAIKEIRQEAHMQELPIIALTALAMKGDKERLLLAGANAYLSKPVKLKQLKKLLEQLT